MTLRILAALVFLMGVEGGIARAVCGNGIIEAGEDCDGINLGGNTCADVIPGAGGTLACSAQCLFDTWGCTICGDGVRNFGEACDCGLELTMLPPGCMDVNGGPNANCALDCSKISRCGDGITDVGELCDCGMSEEFRPTSCITFNGQPGSTCSVTCGRTVTCGDGFADGSEECDGSDFKGQSCAALGSDTGSLACRADCTVDSVGCFPCNSGGLMTLIDEAQLSTTELSGYPYGLLSDSLGSLPAGGLMSCAQGGIEGASWTVIQTDLAAGEQALLRLVGPDFSADCLLFSPLVAATLQVASDDARRSRMAGGPGSGLVCSHVGGEQRIQIEGLVLVTQGTGFSAERVTLHPDFGMGNYLVIHLSSGGLVLRDLGDGSNTVVLDTAGLGGKPVYVDLDDLSDLAGILSGPQDPVSGCGCASPGGDRPWLLGMFVLLVIDFRRRRRRKV